MKCLLHTLLWTYWTAMRPLAAITGPSGTSKFLLRTVRVLHHLHSMRQWGQLWCSIRASNMSKPTNSTSINSWWLPDLVLQDKNPHKYVIFLMISDGCWWSWWQWHLCRSNRPILNIERRSGASLRVKELEWYAKDRSTDDVDVWTGINRGTKRNSDC